MIQLQLEKMKDVLEQLEFTVRVCTNGVEALGPLKDRADLGKNITEELLLMFTDAGMPEMDRYRLTT